VERPSFGKEYILDELNKISARISIPINLFVIGGLVVIHFGLKEATKDIDVVVQSEHEFYALKDVLESLGYSRPRPVMISRAYKVMEASEILENSDGFRWDIFYGRICGALSFSPTMVARASIFYRQKGLLVALASKEDIFLFKGITEREADLDDMRLLAESGLKWKVVEKECRNQSISSGRLWENALYENLIDLREKHKIRSPIEKTLRRVVEKRLVEDAIIQAIRGGSNTIKTISDTTEFPPYLIRASAEKLEKRGLLKIDRSKRPYRFTST